MSLSATSQEPARLPTHESDPSTSIRYVSTSQAELFAGPGDDFYPTAVLKAGQSIEVHQETADGWLAITPPAGSFSWLPAAHGLLLPGGRVVEVTEKSAVSWIGTSLGTAKQYRWQVKLERGQQLAVIGEQSIPDPKTGGKALWYKITPPSGEYRWIQAKATSLQLPTPAKLASSTDEPMKSVVEEPTASNEADQVVPASAEQSIASNKSQSRAVARPKPQPHTDRWADWHAVEFKNGAFSFPGVARMLGIQPAPSTGSRPTDDPFDLTASYARRPPNKLNLPKSTVGADAIATDDSQNSDTLNSSMAVRQSRGWRDPRQLRQERLRGGLDEESSDETALAANEPFDEAAEVLDASFEQSSEIGTSVITAGATETRGSTARNQRRASGPPPSIDEQGNEEHAWYGIEQAPASQIARSIQSTNAGLSSLDDVQLALSTIVAGPEHTWNLAPLAQRARYFIEHGQDSLQRGQARLLLERIESFMQIARQSGVPSAPQNPNAMRGSPTTSVATTLGIAPASAASWIAPPSTNATNVGDATSPRFDATGWLVPVHSSGHDMPTHALTNDVGRIIVYVTPAPGVNLTRFESQAIGVFGLRGYLPQLKSNHIQIQRVVRLQ